MTTLLCLNPKSRSGDCDCEAYLERLHRLGPVVLHRLGEDDLEGTLASLVGKLSRLVIGGGDGTLNRLLPTAVETGVPLGVLPLGTANDFARALSLPNDPLEALDVVLENHTRRIGLGVANGRWFVNAAGIGLGPEITKNLDHQKKRRLGVLAYLAGVIEAMGNRRRRKALIEIDGTKRRVSFMQITIANGVHYGGGLTVAREVDLNDGRLRVLILRPQTPMELLSKFFKLRWGPSEKDDLEKMELITAEEVRIETTVPHDVTLDGELISGTPLQCRSVPDALEVYAPVGEGLDRSDSTSQVA